MNSSNNNSNNSNSSNNNVAKNKKIAHIKKNIHYTNLVKIEESNYEIKEITITKYYYFKQAINSKKYIKQGYISHETIPKFQEEVKNLASDDNDKFVFAVALTGN